MANPRGTFAKRNREMKLKDRAKEKAERKANRKVDTGETKGPQIAWDQPGGIPAGGYDVPDAPPAADAPSDTDND
jgi:hypothetical protein